MASKKSNAVRLLLVLCCFFAITCHLQMQSCAGPILPDESNQSSSTKPDVSIPTVTLQTLGQETVQGQLVALTNLEIGLSTDGVSKVIPTSEVERIGFDGSVPIPSPQFPHLITVDNSAIAADQISGEGKNWNLESKYWKLTAPISTSQIKTLRLKDLVGEQQSAWQDLISQPETADSVIAVRPTGDLTRVDGTIVAIKEAKVHFEFDDQKLEMPIERLAGLTWFTPRAERYRLGVQVVTKDGSIWNVQQLELKGSTLTIETLSRMNASIPLSSLSEVRMGSANLAWVKDAEKLDAQSSFEAIQKRSNPLWKLTDASAAKMFTPRFVSVPGTQVAAKNSSSFDLHFVQPGYYEFRMPEGFKTFESTVTRSEEGQVRSDLVLEVWQDTDRVWQEKLSADQISANVRVDLVEGKKVKLSVIDLAEGSIGTEVYWRQPRLLK